MLCWILFAALTLSLIWGLATTIGLFDAIAGYPDTADLDQLVREAW
jgi:hypothetical protein